MAIAHTGTNSSAAASYAGTKRRLRIWFIFVALFMGWALYTLLTQLVRQGDAETKLASATKQIEEAQKQVKDLKLQVTRLSDKEYIGQLATKEQGMVGKGEKQIVGIKQP
ncbi:FtsB family cell division protein [Paenibacillus albus]|uniref:Septum formation initiator family protein n=1 Tax=Paenibacillus albus TaxID=2495582 RepID=A0A3Q8X2G0_9BACL|nr:septum formation initiator family protein [Paenibacillus albus]AZN38921.1 septum formation initiator family protein [Paenibacillus albus]